MNNSAGGAYGSTTPIGSASVCFCVGGPNCCIKRRQIPPTYPQFPESFAPYYQAIKCVDCGVWWRGETHICMQVLTNGTLPLVDDDATFVY